MGSSPSKLCNTEFVMLRPTWPLLSSCNTNGDGPLSRFCYGGLAMQFCRSWGAGEQPAEPCGWVRRQVRQAIRPAHRYPRLKSWDGVHWHLAYESHDRISFSCGRVGGLPA